MVQRRAARKKRKTRGKLPPDFDEFCEWLGTLPISRGARQTAIAGVRKAFSLGLKTVEEVRELPPNTKGLKSMRYGMHKYEEFQALKVQYNLNNPFNRSSSTHSEVQSHANPERSPPEAKGHPSHSRPLGKGIPPES